MIKAVLSSLLSGFVLVICLVMALHGDWVGFVWVGGVFAAVDLSHTLHSRLLEFQLKIAMDRIAALEEKIK